MKKREGALRAASLAERQEYYNKEFNIKKVKKWFYHNGLKLPQLCAVDAGTETGIIIDKKLKGRMLYFHFGELEEKIKEYVPEDVYYDRNLYAHPNKILRTLKFDNPIEQELAFDIDADNIKCVCPKGEKLCEKCLLISLNWAGRMKKELEREFKKIKIVYSGRGFHIHVFDKKAFLLSILERKKLNRKFSRYPIDPWVSGRHIRLIRMPYSLNGLVSRKATILGENLKFDMRKSYPKFLD